MRQYQEIKSKFPDTLVLFQVGDFYELFFDDAKKAAAFLGITLTKRGVSQQEPIPLCGVPVHALDHYVLKLIKGGFRVAICDQLSAPVPGKIVERGVRQVLTPGTLTDSALLPEKSTSYLAALFPIEQTYGLVFAELLTGHAFITIVERQEEKLLEAELARFNPDEIIVPHTKLGIVTEQLIRKWGYVTTNEPWTLADFDQQHFMNWLGTSPVIAFIEQSEAARSALIVLYRYFSKNHERALEQVRQFFVYSGDDYLLLDAATLRNLEIVKNTTDGSSTYTLFSVLDRAATSMGSRTIKKWITRPLIKKESIEQRLDVVELLINNRSIATQLHDLLKQVGDVERIVGRIALQRAYYNDYVHLKAALQVLPAIKKCLMLLQHSGLLQLFAERISTFNDLVIFLEDALNNDESREWLIKKGFNGELDRLRTLVDQGARAVVELERKEQQLTSINSLKIRYNNVHGYGIEVTRPNLHLVPPHYIRLQTLLNRERFTTQALKDLEYDCAYARTNSQELEKELFAQLVQKVFQEVTALKKMAHVCAQLDAFNAFAGIAYEQQYVRPIFTTNRDIIIDQGKHPVVAAHLQHVFIPNDTQLTDTQLLWIITGPNMGGKSTYLRQVALIQIMAQAGSFVSAKKAQLPIIDRIFTRIGAADKVAEGKSTFLVEMEETALICHQATEKSLVILDEVGRGTSTYDGLAIAQAVIEYIYTQVKARCLFATHYHELTALTQQFPALGIYHAASQQTEQGIVLLHKILPGCSDGSFGIDVARTAHLPDRLIVRAQEILMTFKNNKNVLTDEQAMYLIQELQQQIKVLTNKFNHIKSIQDQLEKLDYEALSPKQAFDMVWQWKQVRS